MAGDKAEEDDPDDHYYVLPDAPDQADEPAAPGFEVMPQNWRAYHFFCQAGTQWTNRPDGGVAGLNYQAVESILRMNSVPLRQHARLLADIRLIERGAISELLKARETNGTNV